MDSKIKKLVAGVALAGALTVGTAGVAFAADGSGTTTDPSAQAASVTPACGTRSARGAVEGRHRHARREPPGPARPPLKGGQTISEYATSLGKDPQAVVDALTNAANTKLDQLVADGKITPGAGRHDQGQAPGPDRQADEPPVRPARQRLTVA